MHGVPRLYRKTAHRTFAFEDLYDRFFGRFAVTAHGGRYEQTPS